MAGIPEQGESEEDRVLKLVLANLDLTLVVDKLQKEVKDLKEKKLKCIADLERTKNERAHFEREMRRKIRKLEPTGQQDEIEDLKGQLNTASIIANTLTKQLKELKEKNALSSGLSVAANENGTDDQARAEVEQENKFVRFKLKRTSDEVDYLKRQLKSENDNGTVKKAELGKLEVKVELQASQLELANRRVQQLESEKKEWSVRKHQQEEELKRLEVEVRNAAVKEDFHKNLMSDRGKEMEKLRGDLKKALEEKKSFQDKCSNQEALLISMTDSLKEAEGKIKQKENDTAAINESIATIEENYENEKAIWSASVKAKDVIIKELKESQEERDKLISFAEKMKKLHQFEWSDPSSSIVNELEKLEAHISKRVVIVGAALVKSKPVPKPRGRPAARKRKSSKLCDSTTSDPLHAEEDVAVIEPLNSIFRPFEKPVSNPFLDTVVIGDDNAGQGSSKAETGSRVLDTMGIGDTGQDSSKAQTGNNISRPFEKPASNPFLDKVVIGDAGQDSSKKAETGNKVQKTSTVPTPTLPPEFDYTKVKIAKTDSDEEVDVEGI